MESTRFFLCLARFSLLLTALIFFSKMPAVFAEQPTPKPATTSTPLQAFAGLQIKDPARTLKRLLKVQHLLDLDALTPLTAPFLPLLAPLRQGKAPKDLRSFFREAPTFFATIGLKLDHPINLVAYQQGKDIHALLSFEVDAHALERTIKSLALPIQLNAISTQTSLLLLPNQQVVGILHQHRAYIILSSQQKIAGAITPHIQSLLEPLVWKQPQRAESDFAALLEGHLCAPTSDFCAKFSLKGLHTPDSQFAQILLSAQRYIQGVSFHATVARKIKVGQHFHFSPKASPFLQLFRPQTALLPWLEKLPLHLGWFGRAHLSPEAISNLETTLKQEFPSYAKNIASEFLKVRMFIKGLQQVTGEDIEQLLKSLQGDYAGGFLWGKSMAGIAQSFRKNQQPFRGHLRGLFLALGFKTEAAATHFLPALTRLLTRFRPMIPYPFHIKIEKQGEQQLLQIHPQGIEPFYLTTHKNYLFFLGHKQTHEEMSAVWKGLAPSAASLFKTPTDTKAPFLKGSLSPFAAFAAKKNHSALFFHPRVARDLAEWLAPPPVRMLARNLWANLAFIGLSDRLTETTYTSEQVFSWSPKPLVSKDFLDNRAGLIKHHNMENQPNKANESPLSLSPVVALSLYTGNQLLPTMVLLAVAIPTYLRFTRQSKTSEAIVNLGAIAKGAIGSFHEEPSQDPKTGIDKPREFPCAGQGWICTPKALPCAKGNPLYTKKPSRWDHACWKKLSFEMHKEHYFRYCYKAEGSGFQSKAIIYAEADLDCDQIRSRYERRLHVDSKTGEVKVGNLLKFRPLE